MFSGGFLLILALPLLLVMFMTRSQNKKQKQLEESLKVGDRVVTRAGIIGKILDMGERTVKLEIAPGVVVTALKVSIEGHDKPKDDAKKDDKSKDKGSDKDKASDKDAKSDGKSKSEERETKKAS